MNAPYYSSKPKTNDVRSFEKSHCGGRAVAKTHSDKICPSSPFPGKSLRKWNIATQNPEPLRNSSEKIQLLANKYCASITPRNVKTIPKKRLTATQLRCNGDPHFSLLTKTTSPLFGKRLWEMRHVRAVYISVLHHSSWKVYLPLDFVNYLITQPIWQGVY